MGRHIAMQTLFPRAVGCRTVHQDALWGALDPVYPQQHLRENWYLGCLSWLDIAMANKTWMPSYHHHDRQPKYQFSRRCCWGYTGSKAPQRASWWTVSPNSLGKSACMAMCLPMCHLPPPMLVFTPAPSVNTGRGATASGHIWGPKQVASKSNKKLTVNAKADSFFQSRLPSKSEGRQRIVEHIANKRKSQEFLDTHTQTLRKERAHQLNQEYQTRYHDKHVMSKLLLVAASSETCEHYHQNAVSQCQPLFTNILLILMRHLQTKMPVLLNCHGLIINIKRVRRRTITQAES